MAEALGIVGASASILGIIHLLGKTVITLHTLRTRYQEAAFTFLNLIAQLTALKAALNQLQTWMDTDIDELHHQLVMDLELSVTCCKMLVGRIDDEVEGMEVGELDGREKIRMVMKNGTLEDLQKMIDRQTSALMLLLTVCNCKAVSEQKALLEKSSTRKAFTRIRDDTSSLYVQRDSASFYSRCTDNLSRISAKFSFDNELFTTTVYSKAIRGTMKDALQTARRPANLMASRYSDQKRQEKIEEELMEDSKKQKRICSVLMRGDSECAQKFVVGMRMLHGEEFSRAERAMYLKVVMRNVLQVMEDMISFVEDGGFDLQDSAKRHLATLAREIEEIKHDGDERVTSNAAYEFKALWNDENVATMLRKAKNHITTPSAYLLTEIDRIIQSDYLPTDTDISTLATGRRKNQGIQEHNFTHGTLSIRLLDISAQRSSERRQWIHQFQDVTSIVYFVDLAAYDDPDADNPLLSSVHAFESAINSPWFLRSSVILFLCNVREFGEKLTHKPLGDYFPDYDGRDAREASKYLLEKFTGVNRSQLDLYPHLCEPADFSIGQLLFAALKETIMHNALVEAKILLPKQAAPVDDSQRDSQKQKDDTAYINS